MQIHKFLWNCKFYVHLFVLLFFSRLFGLRRLPLALDFCHWLLNFIFYFVSAWLVSIEDEFGIGWFHFPKRVKRKVISSTDFRTTQIKLENESKMKQSIRSVLLFVFEKFAIFAAHTYVNTPWYVSTDASFPFLYVIAVRLFYPFSIFAVNKQRTKLLRNAKKIYHENTFFLCCEFIVYVTISLLSVATVN